MKLLIVGFGSAGKRLALSALALGVEVVSWDPAMSTLTLAQKLDLESNLTHACICSPPGEHYTGALACLQHGLHVLVEKPLAMTAVDGALLVQQAQESHLQLAVACQLRYLSTTQKVYTDFFPYRQESWIGDAHFGYDIRRWHPPEQPYTPRIGVLLEVGTHELDLLCWLFGTEPSVYAHRECTAMPWGEAPCLATALLGFHHSIIAVHLDYISAVYRRYFSLSQETRYINWNLDPNRDAQALLQASHDMLRDFLFPEQDELSTRLATGREGVLVLELIQKIQQA